MIVCEFIADASVVIAVVDGGVDEVVVFIIISLIYFVLIINKRVTIADGDELGGRSGKILDNYNKVNQLITVKR